MIAILKPSRFCASRFCDRGFDNRGFVIAVFNVHRKNRLQTKATDKTPLIMMVYFTVYLSIMIYDKHSL